MVGQKNADVVLLDQVADLVLDLGDRLGVDAGERLVEHDHLGLGDQRPRDLDAPALAAGDAVGLGLADLGQAELVQQLILPVFSLLPGHLRSGFEDRHQVVFDGQLAEDARILSEVSHAGAGADTSAAG